jgi:uncharacterized protein
VTRQALCALMLMAVAAHAQTAPAPAPAPPPTDSQVDLRWGVKIPLRDGVHLNATVYVPHRQAAPLPAIFTLTPYISDSYHARALYFARNGYVYVLVDVRGRGNSEGTFEPFAHDAKDGADVVEWLARQPWCNGKVAMWGGSYAGFDQWATAKEFPPHLTTIVPAAAAHPAVDFPFHNGVYYSYDIQWLTFTSGVTPNANLFGEDGFWRAKFHEFYVHHLPFATLDSIVGNRTSAWHTWLAHSTPDAYWSAMAPGPSDYQRLTIPILTITGDYDGDQLGALTYYRRHMRLGTPAVTARHYLIIGPWDHAGTRTPKPDVGGLHFAQASVVDLNALHKAWYDWTMKDGPRPEFLKARVAYYVTGADTWRYADSLGAIAPTRRRLYLTSGSDGAGDAFHSGTLADAAPAAGGPDHFTYDPLDTLPGSLEMADIPNYITDERGALNLFGDGVAYHTTPLPGDLEISGTPHLVLWLALDAPDADLAATLYEIRPDGQSISLTSELIRARYRDSTGIATAVRPGAIARYDFTGFTWFSRRVERGSRLRLVITCPNSIYLEKNYDAGGVVAEESGRDARVTRVLVYHDATHQSYLEIPVGTGP